MIKTLERDKDQSDIDAKSESIQIPTIEISDVDWNDTLLYGTLRNSKIPVSLIIIERNDAGERVQVATLLMPNVKTVLMELSDLKK